MKRVALCICALILLSTPSLFAQEPQAGNRGQFDPFLQDVSPAARPPADANGPNRYVTRQELVFRKAALRAAQRQERIARNKALGYSPLRPPASAVPAMGSGVRRPAAVLFYPGTLYPWRVAY
jgi:hypothetical protein